MLNNCWLTNTFLSTSNSRKKQWPLLLLLQQFDYTNFRIFSSPLFINSAWKLLILWEFGHHSSEFDNKHSHWIKSAIRWNNTTTRRPINLIVNKRELNLLGWIQSIQTNVKMTNHFFSSPLFLSRSLSILDIQCTFNSSHVMMLQQTARMVE